MAAVLNRDLRIHCSYAKRIFKRRIVDSGELSEFLKKSPEFVSLVIKKPLSYNSRHNLSNTGPRGYLLGRLTDPVKRTAYQLVPSWSATGLWDCSFEDSGIYQRFDHFKKRFPHIFKFGKSYLSTNLCSYKIATQCFRFIYERKNEKKNVRDERDCFAKKRESRGKTRCASEQLRY